MSKVAEVESKEEIHLESAEIRLIKSIMLVVTLRVSDFGCLVLEGAPSENEKEKIHNLLTAAQDAKQRIASL